MGKIKGAALIAAAALALTVSACGAEGGDDSAGTSSDEYAACTQGVDLKAHPECVNHPGIEGSDPESSMEDEQDYPTSDETPEEGKPAPMPTTVLKKLRTLPKLHVPANAKYGEVGVDGERTVDFGEVNEHTLTMLPSPRPAGWEVGEPEDGVAVINGKDFSISLLAASDGSWDVTPGQVAKVTGGKLVPTD